MNQNASEGKAAPSGLGRIGKAVKSYAEARMNRLVSAAENKVTELTESLANVGSQGNAVSSTGARVLSGESPAKAVAHEGGEQVKQATGQAKDAVSGALKSAKPGSDNKGGGAGKAGDKKVTNIIEVLDIGLPVRTCYDHWTEFEEFSGFMKGVVEASRSDDDVTTNWKLKVGPSHRSWEATIQEQVPDERIVWTSEGSRGTTHGAVSFHDLTPDLTRIVVVVEYTPAGFFEKTANIWRAQGRRLRLDLKHFQRYVSLGAEEEPEGWRGEIHDGEVVLSHEEALRREDGEREGDREDREEGDGEGKENDVPTDTPAGEEGSEEKPEKQEKPEK